MDLISQCHTREKLFQDYIPLSGDRNFADDHAVMGGIGRFNDQPVIVLGQEKGYDTKTRIERNFGMARPEGYRKAIRLMDLADRFNLPVITLVDTPGAPFLAKLDQSNIIFFDKNLFEGPDG